jgi:L-cysteine desulfidase
MISDISGIICDGASNSCAMKVSTATACAFKSVLMAQQIVLQGSVMALFPAMLKVLSIIYVN